MKKGKTDIFLAGRTLFAERGFKDTGVSDITKMAGIAVGTFYNYYESKEQLFLEIFLQEDAKLKEGIIKSVCLDDDPAVVAKEVIIRLFQGHRENPILKEWFSEDVYKRIRAQMAVNEAQQEHDDFSYHLFLGLIKQWQAAGKIRSDLDSGLVLAFFNSLSYIDLHKEDIGPQYFPELIERFVEFIVDGLR